MSDISVSDAKRILYLSATILLISLMISVVTATVAITRGTEVREVTKTIIKEVPVDEPFSSSAYDFGRYICNQWGMEFSYYTKKIYETTTLTCKVGGEWYDFKWIAGQPSGEPKTRPFVVPSIPIDNSSKEIMFRVIDGKTNQTIDHYDVMYEGRIVNGSLQIQCARISSVNYSGSYLCTPRYGENEVKLYRYSTSTYTQKPFFDAFIEQLGINITNPSASKPVYNQNLGVKYDGVYLLTNGQLWVRNLTLSSSSGYTTIENLYINPLTKDMSAERFKYVSTLDGFRGELSTDKIIWRNSP